MEILSKPSQQSGTREGFLDIAAIAPPINGAVGASRGAILGRSGSGKSFLAERLLRLYSPTAAAPFRGSIIIFDPDESFVLEGEKKAVVVHNPEEVVPKKNLPLLIYRPTPDHADSAESWNLALRNIYYSKVPLVLYIDEFRALKPLFPPKKMEGGNYLTVILTRGRKKLKAVIMAMQRPSNVDLDSLAQADYFYIFDLPFEADRDRVKGIVGGITADGRDVRDRNALNRFEFYYFGPNVRLPTRSIIRR